jgi:hypothetical protein
VSTPEAEKPPRRKGLFQRFWDWITRREDREKFKAHEAEIDRKIHELDERIARGCRQTDGRVD